MSFCYSLRDNYPNILFCRVDGGVSQNDFIMQSLADLTGLEVERPVSVEMSILGVAFLAGLQCGMNYAILLLRIIYISHISKNFKSFFILLKVCVCCTISL